MRKFIIILIVHCTLLITHCFAQSITWQRIYDNPNHYYDGASSLCQGDGNNFYAVGYAVTTNNVILILKLNQYGDTLWTRTIDYGGIGKIGYASYTDGNGGFVATGDGDSAYIININTNGSLNWYKNYSTRSVTCLDILKTIDKGYIACGRMLGGDYHGYAVRVNSSGSLIWQKIYTSTEYKGYSSVIEADNGGFVLAGKVSNSFDTLHVLLTRINNSGDIIWENSYTIFGHGVGNRNKIFKTANSYLIAGTTSDTTGAISQIFIMKTDTSGNVFFMKRFESNNNEYLRDIKVINANKYLFAIVKDSSQMTQISKIIVTDSLGTIMQQRSFTNPYSAGYIWFESLLIAPNGDYISGGLIDQYNENEENVFIVRVDTSLYAPPIGINRNILFQPNKFELYPVYPNPFNSESIITFDLQVSSDIKLSLFDVTGREIAVLLRGKFNKGKHQHRIITEKYRLSSGIYFIMLETSSGFKQTQKLILLK
jgi:hypothetical protein